MGAAGSKLRQLSWRSPTFCVNVVQFTNPDETAINVFNEGRAESSHVLPGHVSLAEAFIWYGTLIKLKGE
jgi:hypothetical protein